MGWVVRFSVLPIFFCTFVKIYYPMIIVRHEGITMFGNVAVPQACMATRLAGGKVEVKSPGAAMYIPVKDIELANCDPVIPAGTDQEIYDYLIANHFQ